MRCTVRTLLYHISYKYSTYKESTVRTTFHTLLSPLISDHTAWFSFPGALVEVFIEVDRAAGGVFSSRVGHAPPSLRRDVLPVGLLHAFGGFVVNKIYLFIAVLVFIYFANGAVT